MDDRYELVKASLGDVKADLVIKNCTLVNVYTGELIDGVDIAVKGSRIAYVGRDAGHAIGAGTRVIDAGGLFAAPGLIDGHTHIDLYCTPARQAPYFLIHGTTCVFSDCCEVVNVLGYRGFKLFLDQVRGLPIKVYVLVPLICPQDPLLEGQPLLSVEETDELLRIDGVAGLGEAVSWVRVLAGDEEYMRKFELATRTGKVIVGHSAGARDRKLQAYVSAGIYSCHEAVSAEEAIERLRLGVYTMIREGSIRRDLERILPGLLRLGVDLRMAMLVSDIVDPEDLVKLGYMDYIVRRAVECGLDPVKAIQMATITPAQYFRVDHEVGGIGPGREADILILEDLGRVSIKGVVCRGRLSVWNGELLVEAKDIEYPRYVYETVGRSKRFTGDDFRIRVGRKTGYVRMRAMHFVNEAVTRMRVLEVPVRDHEVVLEEGTMKVAVINRKETSRFSLGLLTGFNAEIGAVASTINFDEYNIVVVGRSDSDMARAVNRVVDLNGGIVLFDNGRLISEIPLPIASIMSAEDPPSIASKLEHINSYLRSVGCGFRKPINTLYFITFVTLPEVRMTDKGLVDVKGRRYISPIVED